MVMNDNDNDNETDPILVKGNQIFSAAPHFSFSAFVLCQILLVSCSLRDINVWINPMRQDQNQKFFARNLGQKRFKNLSGSLIIITLAAANE
jgi:hypothetical protein